MQLLSTWFCMVVSTKVYQNSKIGSIEALILKIETSVLTISKFNVRDIEL